MSSLLPSRLALPRPTDRLRIGQGPEVSPLCLGCVHSEDMACEAFDAGINFFFLSADLHWPFYESARRGLGRLLARGRDIRDRIVVAGVSYVAHPSFSRAAFEELREAVPGLRRLDLLVAGGIRESDREQRVFGLRGMRDEHLHGAWACAASFHHRPAALASLQGGEVDLAFVRYNSLHPGAAEDLFPHLEPERRAPVFGFNSTRAYLTPDRLRQLGLEEYWAPTMADHYRFALSHPGLDGLLCAPATLAEWRVLLDALAKGPLAPEDAEHMLALSGADLSGRKASSAAPAALLAEA